MIQSELNETTLQTTNSYEKAFPILNEMAFVQYFITFSDEAMSANIDITSNTQRIVLIVSIPMILGSILVYGTSFLQLIRYKKFQEGVVKFYYHTDKYML